MAAGVVMSIAYGHDISPKGDVYVALAESNSQAIYKAIRPGAYLVDILPIRRCLLNLSAVTVVLFRTIPCCVK